MPDLTFTTPEGQTIDRELLIAYLNTGSSESPVWSVCCLCIHNFSIF